MYEIILNNKPRIMNKNNPLNLANLSAESKQKDYEKKINDKATQFLDELTANDFTYVDMTNVAETMKATVQKTAMCMPLKDIKLE